MKSWKEIFYNNAKKMMVHWNDRDFEKEFPTLSKVLEKSANEYASQHGLTVETKDNMPAKKLWKKSN